MEIEADGERYPMLSESNLMVVALRTCAETPALPDECMRRLLDYLRSAHVEPPPDELPALRRQVVAAFRDLCIAGLLDPDEEGRCAITPLGRDVLRSHPHGVDGSVLMRFPSYRSYARRPFPFPKEDHEDEPGREPRPEYDEGYAAYRAGRRLTDNPYQTDSVAHLEWENGWSEAREEAARAHVRGWSQS